MQVAREEFLLAKSWSLAVLPLPQSEEAVVVAEVMGEGDLVQRRPLAVGEPLRVVERLPLHLLRRVVYLEGSQKGCPALTGRLFLLGLVRHRRSCSSQRSRGRGEKPLWLCGGGFLEYEAGFSKYYWNDGLIYLNIFGMYAV